MQIVHKYLENLDYIELEIVSNRKGKRESESDRESERDLISMSGIDNFYLKCVIIASLKCEDVSW